jgi:hypothetical protein
MDVQDAGQDEPAETASDDRDGVVPVVMVMVMVGRGAHGCLLGGIVAVPSTVTNMFVTNKIAAFQDAGPLTATATERAPV